MTHLTLMYFAAAREAMGVKQEEVEVEAKTVLEVLRWLYRNHRDKLVPLVMDEKGRLNREYRLLLNGTECKRASFGRVHLKDGDVLVLMPPVAGG